MSQNRKVNCMDSFLAWSHRMTEDRKSTFTLKLLEFFSATLGLSWAGKSRCQQHGWHAPPSLPLTSHPRPTVQDHYGCQLHSSYLSCTQRGRRTKLDGEIQWGISYSATKTTVKREWRVEWDNEGASEWVGEWATSKKSHSTLLYFDFINGNGFPWRSILMNLSILTLSQPLLLKSTFFSSVCLL